MERAVDLVLGGMPIRALSIGGIETCFEVPAFDVCLDIGRCPPGAERRGTLLLTHGHIDHAAGLPYYVSMRGLYKYPPPRVFCPKEAEPHLAHILETWTHLQADTDRCSLTGVTPGETIPLSGNAYAKTFRSPHRIACIGYTLVKRVRKLKPELVGLSGVEIAERARRGEPVDDVTEREELCFPGDTTIDVLVSEPSVGRARVLLLECTFVEDRVPAKKARSGGHVHLDDLAAHAAHLQNEAILLTHFSRRFRPSEIRAAVDRALPPELRSRVHLLLHADDER
ncbi:MBL fold metallo-hydrolase [Myxococcota bacterium]|nr:MBL fold metallo-hydrolase [Myxococcota bacterium]